MKRKKLFRFFVSLALTFLIALFILLLSNAKTFQILELKALDLRFNLQKEKTVQLPIVHIDIDDASLSQLGRWPWPRSLHAKLLDTLSELGAKQVLMDILFTEEYKDNLQEDVIFTDAIGRCGMTYLPFYFIKEGTVPSPQLEKLLLKDITLSSDQAAESLKRNPDSFKDEFSSAKRYVMDEVLRDALRQRPDLSLDDLFKQLEESKGWYLFPTEESYIRENFPQQKISRFFINRFARDYHHPLPAGLKEFKTLHVPIKQFILSIKDTGFINAEPDPDGVMRRVPLFIKYENKVFPQLSMAGLLDFLKVKDVVLKEHLVILKAAHLQNQTKDIEIPVDDEMAMLVNWTGRWGSCFKHIPYYYLLELQETRKQVRQRLDGILAKKGQELSVQEKGEVDYLTSSDKKLKEELAGMVKDKICIVGLTATGTQDLKPIPLQTKYPMVGMHSNMMYTIVERDFIKKVGTSLNLFLLFFTALIIGFGSLMKLSRSLALSLCYILGYFFLTLWAFDKFGLWLDLVAPVSVVVFGFSATTSFRFFTEEREKLWIKQAFSHYLSAEVINQLIEDPSKLKLGGERKILTVLFADVRGFTKFSESHQPEEVVSILNMIFSQLVKTLFKHNGTLDKFVGDQIMAFFGAPGDIHKDTHAFYAVRTAIEMQARLRGLQEELIREKKQPLQVGIGINTGEMVVGNMGSSERMDYTVIGDNVNLASRLCAAAAGDEIIIGKATYEQIKDKIKAQALAPITVKGKSEPIEIYKVIGFMEQIE